MQQMRQIRLMMALAMLAVSAYTDIKERNIYVMPLLIPSAGAVLITVISAFALSGNEGGRVLFDHLILPVAAGALMILAAKLAKRRMGMGDGYLTASLFLLVGVRCGLFAILCGSVAASVYAGAAMLKKNKGRMRIPFAPFVMTGFMVLLINEI